MSAKILVSSCLLGHKVRYDEGDVPCLDPRFLRWYEEGRMVHICPEVTGGLPTPREDAQIREDRVLTRSGEDVTEAFDSGAQATLKLAQAQDVVFAILKQNSPSCGSLFIYDGSFQGTKKPGEGRTAALLRQHGIQVFGEDQLDEAEQALARVEA